SKSKFSGKKSSSEHPAKPWFKPKPASVSATSTPFKSNSSEKSKGRLSPQEREKRQKQGLCFYCGKAGHVKANCPESRTGGVQPHRVAATLSSPTGSITEVEEADGGISDDSA